VGPLPWRLVCSVLLLHLLSIAFHIISFRCYSAPIFVVLFGAAKGCMTLVRPAFVAELDGRAHYASIAGVLPLPPPWRRPSLPSARAWLSTLWADMSRSCGDSWVFLPWPPPRCYPCKPKRLYRPSTRRAARGTTDCRRSHRPKTGRH
jgi:hypothetical protein